MIRLTEAISKEDINYDLVDMQKKVVYLTNRYYDVHLRDLVLQAKQDAAAKFNWLFNFPILKFFNLKEHIKKLRYDEEASITYEFKNDIQYRFVFTSINRNKFDKLEKYPHFTTKDGVIVYYPYLRVSINVRNNMINSISIYTIGYFDNIPPDGKFYNAEYRTTLKINVPVINKTVATTTTESNEYITEVFKKYINKLDLDKFEKLINAYITNYLDKHISDIISKFNEEITNNGLEFLINFPIQNFLNKDILTNTLEYDSDISSATNINFNNYYQVQAPSPLLIFNNGSKLYPPNFNINFIIESGQIKKVIFSTIITITNIPNNSTYFLKRGEKKFQVITDTIIK